MSIRNLALLGCLCTSFSLFAQSGALWRASIDVQHYHFTIELNDASDVIEAEAEIDLVFREEVTEFVLDLVQKDDEGKGMVVRDVLEDGKPVRFAHKGDSLVISPERVHSGEIRSFSVIYSGIPKDGLIIGTNKHGHRTFFGDNWPNRAHNWLACVDHPSDKATVTWTVRAPNHYQVVANGSLKEELDISPQIREYVYETIAPLPPKVMVIGVAAFAVQNLGEIENIPLSSWIYPEDKDAGFYDYAQAWGVIDFFMDKVGPYPFLKLANVQSTTRFGGMENAGNIFYFENSVTGQRKAERLIAHEVAHQWFGNSASEADWPHFWLSEGFATYFTDLYIEFKEGRDSLASSLQKERQSVINFHKRRQSPVVDNTPSNLMTLLNPNSYQKGGWVLHMLRRKLGDEAFWQGIRTYYKTYALGNATTSDLQRIMEKAGGQDLEPFFQQWLYRPGQPVLDHAWEYANGKLRVEVNQTQAEEAFSFPLDLQFLFPDGSSRVVTASIGEKRESLTFDVDQAPEEVVLDPLTWLLYSTADK